MFAGVFGSGGVIDRSVGHGAPFAATRHGVNEKMSRCSAIRKPDSLFNIRQSTSFQFEVFFSSRTSEMMLLPPYHERSQFMAFPDGT